MIDRQELFPSLRGQGAIGIDLETRDDDLKRHGAGAHRGSAIAGVGIATEAGFRRYYPVGHECGENLDRAKVMGWLKEQMSLPVAKCGSHLTYDFQFLKVEGITPAGPLWDTELAEPLLCETRYKYGLETLAQDYLGEGKREEEMLAWLTEKFGKKNPKNNIWRAPPEVVAPYVISDVDLPLRIFAKQKAELEKQDLWSLYTMESKLIPLLVEMRLRGVRVDVKKTEKLRDDLRKKQAGILKKIKWDTGLDVQVWAAKSLAKLFDHLNLEYPHTEKTDAPSFKAGWLEQHEHPVAQQVREVRTIDKMCGTFLEGSILEAHYKGRIHTQFNQLKSEDGGAVSGRFSSSKPNLQFIPVRTDVGKLIRSCFIPEEGEVWWKKDYSQIEYRLIVHDAAVLGLKRAAEVAQKYRDDPDTDFHAVVAEMTGLDRTQAKTINFGLAYGEGEEKLAGQLGLTREEARSLINHYHRDAPFIRPLAQGLMGQAKAKGVVMTLLGRKRRFDLWARANPKDRSEVIILPHRFPGAQRAFTHKALNARTQGSAADIMKKAMVDVYESGALAALGVPHLTVHDELDGSRPRTRVAQEALREVSRIMESTVSLRVPLKVDHSEGANWGSTE